MLATFGLERIESGLHRDTVSATDVAAFLEQAQPNDVDTLVRDGMGSALDGLHHRLHEQELATDTRTVGTVAAVLPTRLHLHQRVNPEFQGTRHANRV
jgi:hypothetical protein